MDTLEFLRCILPDDGVNYMVLMTEGRSGASHKAFTSHEAMAEAVRKFDAKPQITVYHALASYHHESIADESGKPRYRVEENLKSIKALWADLDVGEAKAAQGKGYASKTDAALDVCKFCKETGFPSPMFVDSGNGLHAYWPLTRAIPAHEWKLLATQFKACLKHFGVMADSSRTSDAASILRPIGSSNKKDPSNWKPVKLRVAPKMSDPEHIIACISNIVSNYDVICEAVVSHKRAEISAVNAEILDNMYPPKQHDPETLRTNCKQVQAMLGNKTDYDHWFGVLGVVRFFKGVNYRKLAHEWSSKHPTYTERETNQKLDTWDSPPTTCKFLEQKNPGGCAGCKFLGKVTTPLMVAIIGTTPAAELVTAVVDGEEVEVETPELPQGYFYNDVIDYGTMIRELKNKDGVLESHKFSPLRFYPTTRIQQEDGTFSLGFRMHLPDGRLRDFVVQTCIALAGGMPLKNELAKYEICVTHNKDADMHLSAYIRDSVMKLMKTTRETTTMNKFGWTKDMTGFLIGDSMYRDDGTMHKVVLGGLLTNSKNCFPAPASSFDGWVEGIDFMYNRDMMEPMQYTVASGFGSLLIPFIGQQEEYHGIPVALTGSASGKGKSTACRATMTAFGYPRDMTINGSDGSTNNFRFSRMSIMNNIPVIMDEFTGIDAKALSALLYAASNGIGKGRLRSVSGTLGEAIQETWDMSLYITANASLSGLLAAEKANSEAENVRVIEIRTDIYDIPELNKDEVSAAIRSIADCTGAAGIHFIKYLVANKAKVVVTLDAIINRLSTCSPVLEDSKYRFFRHHAACTLAAATIAKELGLLRFDVEKLYAWTVAHLEQQCLDVAENSNVSAEEAFNRMVNDLQPNIIMSVGCKSGINGDIDLTVPKMNQAPVGRFIAAQKGIVDPLADRLYISSHAMRDWCQKQRLDPNKILAFAGGHGALLSIPSGKFYLGKGTLNAGAQLRCHCFDMKRLSDAAAGIPNLTLVTTQSGEEVSA